MRFLRWVLGEAWEKINVRATYREIKALGKKHGKRFFWVAILWECVEDIVFPFFAWRAGMPSLIPVFLVLHFEPIVYPMFFWGFRMWDRMQGREPWEPDRSAQSAYWRSATKVLLFQLATTGWLLAVMNTKPLVILTVLMGLFGFIHERIWHDTNYGIRPDDTVETKRTVAKTCTYALVLVMILFPLLRLAGGPIWKPLAVVQGITLFFYLVLETVWARSTWGVLMTHREPEKVQG
jgi:hypothetical protein